MATDAFRLVSVSNDVFASLAREVELDESAAVEMLLQSGVRLHEALLEVCKDDLLWAVLGQGRSQSQATEGTGLLASVLGAQHIAILQVLGYQPPPPVQDFVDEIIEAVQVVRSERGLDGLAREEAEQARAALRVFAARLQDLLEAQELAAPVHRGLLRRGLAVGARAVLVVAPIIAGYGVQALAESQGIAGDWAKDVGNAVAAYGAGAIMRLLPDSQTQQVDLTTAVGGIEPKAKVRALASVARWHLLRLDLPRFGHRDWQQLVQALIATGSSARELLDENERFDAAMQAFADVFDAFKQTLSEQSLRAVIDAWTNVQSAIEAMEAPWNNLDLQFAALDAEQLRRAEVEAEREARELAEQRDREEAEQREREEAERRHREEAERRAREEAEAAARKAQALPLENEQTN